MTDENTKTKVATQDLLKARSGAAGFSAMAFIGSVVYLAVRSGQAGDMVSVRGLLLLVIGTPVCAFILGYLLLFCCLWLSYFTEQWLEKSQKNALIQEARRQSMVGQRLLSIVGTALMVTQLVVIFVITSWVYEALF